MYSLLLRQSRPAFYADFVIYGAAVPMLVILLIEAAPIERFLPLSATAVAGLVGWTAIEYLFHRFLLHRVKPFSEWHGEHHRRPKELIGTPTLISAALILSIVFLPALLLTDIWSACALMLGMSVGYLNYVFTHYAIHHWHLANISLKRSRQWHALHHSRSGKPSRYGVTTQFWDHLFGSA